MTDKEIIQALKDNEKPFGLMTAEMQEEAVVIGTDPANMKQFLWWNPNFGWKENTEVNFVRGHIYRLRHDYEAPEPEVGTLKGMQGCAWEDAEGDTIAAIRELQDACDILVDTVHAMIERSK